MNKLIARNERKHRFSAMLYTILVITGLGLALLSGGQLDAVIEAVKGMVSPDNTEILVDKKTPVAAI